MANAPTAPKVKEKKTKEKPKAKVFYFKNKQFSALTVQVQKTRKEITPVGEVEQPYVAEEARFVPYYDTWKGDVIRVGYLMTESEAIAKVCENDDTCVSITAKEYKQALEGDEENKPLKRAPIPSA